MKARGEGDEGKMVGQGHRSDQHEIDQTPGGHGRQEGLAGSGVWGHEESDTTKQLDNKNAEPESVAMSFTVVR